MQQLVRVTRHAVERLRLRFPDFAIRSDGVLHRVIAGEVVDAIAAGRMATKLPRWALRPGSTVRTRGKRRNGELHRSIRYVWTRDEGRLYIIDRASRLTTVLTTIKPRADDTEADVDAA